MRKEKDDQLVVGIRSDNTETKILSDENDIWDTSEQFWDNGWTYQAGKYEWVQVYY